MYYCRMVNVYHCGVGWTVAAGRTPVERDVTSGIADWSMSMIVTSEFGDVVA
jgi:hypothetical protein